MDEISSLLLKLERKVDRDNFEEEEEKEQLEDSLSSSNGLEIEESMQRIDSLDIEEEQKALEEEDQIDKSKSKSKVQDKKTKNVYRTDV